MQKENSTLDPVQDLIVRCGQHGRDAAQTTGDLRADPARMEVAINAIAAEVALMWKGAIDLQNPQDALIVEATNQQRERVRRLETAAEQARRIADATQQDVPAPEPPPAAPTIVILAAILALSMTFSISLAEIPLLAEIDDSVLRLLAGAVMGGAIACVCIASMFDLMPYDPQASVVRPKATREIWGFVASVVMVLAFGLIRLSTTGDDTTLTGGLMAVDMACLLYAKASASQYRNRVLVHSARNDARIQHLKAAEDANQAFEKAQALLSQAESDLDASMRQFKYRVALHFDVTVVTKAAITNFQAAYFEGLDQNRGQGAPQPSPFSTANRRTAA